MAGPQRKCANCRYFRDAGLPGNGWCTHPKRQPDSGIKLLVRGGELACRNTWGGDLFQSRLDDSAAPAADADLPGGHQDDEVTSVTIPLLQPVPAEDRVVADRPAPQRDLLDPNEAAHRDQDERARIMARGSRDALAQARKRYTTRRQGASADDVVANDNANETLPDRSGDRVITHRARFSDRFLTPGSTDAPMRAEPVPRDEVSRRQGMPEDRFDTVPEVDPTFHLPGHRDPTSVPAAAAAPIGAESEQESADRGVDEVQITTYEHVLQRARRIRTAKQKGMRPIRHADLRIAVEPPVAEPEIVTEAWAPAFDRAERPHAPDRLDRYQDELWEDDLDVVPTDAAPAWDSHTADLATAHDDAIDAYDDHDDVADDRWDDYDDVPVERGARRNWLGRLGFRRRTADMPYDDANVTRHSAAFDADEPADDPAPADRDTGWDVRDDRDAGWFDLSDDDEDELPAWRDPERIEPRSARTAFGHRSPAPAWTEPEPAATRAVAPGEAPAPVPIAESRAGHWAGGNSEPRPAASTWHRQRVTPELPDLDDNLFESSYASEARPHRSASSVTPEPAGHHVVDVPSRTAADILQSRSPRDSYFRASHFQAAEPEPAPSTARESVARTVETQRLPDLDTAGLDLRDVVARGGELLDMTIDVAPDIPRECRTCRSFRSADGGARGWCTNEWAFTHRRMVNEDDLACETSIGCWWLPADHYRLDVDADDDQGPTPRMDELIARNRPAARRAVGE